MSRSEKTWKPPESVRIGPFQPENAWMPPSSSTMCSPGLEVEVVRVAEDHVGAERAHLVGMERLDGPLRADGHERRGADLTVGRGEDAGARRAVRRVDAERHRASIASPNE